MSPPPPSPVSTILFFLSYSFRNLRRTPLATALTLFGISLGTAIVLAIVQADRSSLLSFKNAVNHVKNPAVLSIVAPSGTFFPDTTIDRVEGALGPAPFRLSPLLELTVVAKGQIFLLKGLDFLESADRPPGKNTRDILSVPGGVYLPPHTLALWHLKTGESLPVSYGTKTVTLKILGEIPETLRTRMLPRNTFLIDLSWAQELFGRNAQITRIDLLWDGQKKIKPSHALVTRLAQSLRKDLGKKVRVLSRKERKSQYDSMLSAYRSNLTALSLVAFLVAYFLIANTLLLFVVRRRAEIATLRLLGVTAREIRLLLVFEAGWFGVLGGLFGILWGQSLATVTLRAVSRTIATMFLPPHLLPSSTSFSEDLLAVAFSLGVCLVAIYAPLREATTIAPVLGLSRMGEEEGVLLGQKKFWGLFVLFGLLSFISSRLPAVHRFPWGGYAAALLAVFSGSFLIPALLSALAPLFRKLSASLEHPVPALSLSAFTATTSRTRIAISGVMASLGMVVGIVVMISSFERTLNLWIDENLTADVYIKPATCLSSYCTETLTDDLYRKIKGTEGVLRVARYTLLSAMIAGKPSYLAYSDLDRFYRKTPLPLVDSPPSSQVLRAFMEGQGVLVSEPFANRFKKEVGDRVTYPTRKGPVTRKILGIYRDYSTIEGILLLPYGQLLPEQGTLAPSNLSLFLLHPDTVGEFLALLNKTLSPDIHLLIRSQNGLRNRILEVFHQSFSVTYALLFISIVVSIFGVSNSLVLLLYERRREFALYRYLGLLYREQILMLFFETVLIVLWGILMGVILGLIVGAIIVFVINREAFGWTILWHLPTMNIFLLCLLLFTASLLSLLAPAYLLKRDRTISGERL
ncbi:MAG: FtsX-like permease family protein [Leptospirales bacterium]